MAWPTEWNREKGGRLPDGTYKTYSILVFNNPRLRRLATVNKCFTCESTKSFAKDCSLKSVGTLALADGDDVNRNKAERLEER